MSLFRNLYLSDFVTIERDIFSYPNKAPAWKRYLNRVLNTVYFIDNIFVETGGRPPMLYNDPREQISVVFNNVSHKTIPYIRVGTDWLKYHLNAEELTEFMAWRLSGGRIEG
jgi:hypothetical protein